MALTEPHVEQMLKASFVVGELLEKFAYVCLFHAIYIANRPPYVKGINPFPKYSPVAAATALRCASANHRRAARSRGSACPYGPNSRNSRNDAPLIFC